MYLPNSLLTQFGMCFSCCSENVFLTVCLFAVSTAKFEFCEFYMNNRLCIYNIAATDMEIIKCDINEHYSVKFGKYYTNFERHLDMMSMD